MKATYDGRTREVGLNPTGYHADTITLQARDVRAIRTMFLQSGAAPGSQFGAWLAQLESRFPDNREPVLKTLPSEN